MPPTPGPSSPVSSRLTTPPPELLVASGRPATTESTLNSDPTVVDLTMSTSPPKPHPEPEPESELDDIPLPAPTTLASHTSGPRLLRSSRSASRSSRGSRSNSGSLAGSRVASRNSSRTRNGSQAERPATGTSGVQQPAIRLLHFEELNDEFGPVAQDVRGAGSSLDQADDAKVNELMDDVQVLPDIGIGLPTQDGHTNASILDVDDQILVPTIVSHTEPDLLRSPRARKRRRVQGAYDLDDEPVVISGPSRRSLPDPDIEILPSYGEATSSRVKLDGTAPAPSSLTQRPAAKQQPTETVIEPEPLSAFSCPICFSPPTNATLTPCGHICCGECLFTAVNAGLKRARTAMAPGPVIPRCPVCRAELKGWDGLGGGVIGLKPRTMLSL